jgi:hypothetical protein
MNATKMTSASMAKKRLSALSVIHHDQESVRNGCSVERDASVIFDIFSRILCCSPAAAKLFGRQQNILVGIAVSELFPSLPLTPHTPGHNIAYTVFHGADNQWLRHMAVLSNGYKVPIDIKFVNIIDNRNSLIVLTMKPLEGTTHP